MKRSYLGIAILLCTLLGTAAGVFLRVYQLTRCMDENGLLIFGSRIPIVLTAFTILLILAMALLCSRLPKTAGDDRLFSSSLPPMLLSAVAAGALLFGCCWHFSQAQESTGTTILLAAGMLSSLLLLATALLRFNNRKVPFALPCLPVLFLVAKLIVDFKAWSHDPAVIDFCFLLLASICSMLSLFNLAGFSLKAGKRRTTIFWCMLSGVFSVITLSDHLVAGAVPDWSVLLISSGLGLWCLTYGVQLLLPDLLNKPAEPEAAAEPELPAEPETASECPTEPEAEN